MGLNWGAGLQAAGQSLGQWAAYQQQLAHEEKIRQQQLADLAAANARVDAEHVRMYGPVIPPVVPAHPASPAMGPITMPPEGPDAESYTWSGSPAIPAIPAITTYPYAGVDLPRDQFGGQYAGQALDSYLQAHPVKTDKPVVPPINYVVTDSSGAQTPFSTTDAPDAVVGRMNEGDRRAVLSGVGPDGAIHITTSTVPKEFAPHVPTAGEELNKQKLMDARIAQTVKSWFGDPTLQYRDVTTTDAKGKTKTSQQQVTVPAGGSLLSSDQIGYLASPEALINSGTRALTDSLSARGYTEWPATGLPPEIGPNILKDILPTQPAAEMALPSGWKFDNRGTPDTSDDQMYRKWGDGKGVFNLTTKRLSIPDFVRQELGVTGDKPEDVSVKSVDAAFRKAYGISVLDYIAGKPATKVPSAAPNLSPQGVSKPGQIDKSLLEDALGIKSGA